MVLIYPLSATTLEKTRVLTLPLQGIKTLSIDAGAGFLKVSGNEKATEIHVKADIRIKEPTQQDCEKILQNNLRLSLVKRGDKAVLTANFEEINHIFTFFSSNDTLAAIDLTVTLPKKMDLYVDDGSGYAQIDSLDGSITVDDGSGDLVIRETSGWLSIDFGQQKGAVGVIAARELFVVGDVLKQCLQRNLHLGGGGLRVLLHQSFP